MGNHPTGKDASIIGEIITNPPGIVLLKTAFGAERIIDMLVGDQLPRIC
jgi:hydrogenase expression/formation protein HypE